MKYYLLTFIFCGLFLSCSFAQIKSHTAIIGVGMLNSSYIGDLNYGEKNHFRAYPGICFSGQFEGKSHLQAQLNIGAGKFIEQYDQVRVRPYGEIIPNNFVNTSFLYGDLRFKYRFIRRRNFQPYISAGMGALSFQPKDEEDYLLLPNTYSRPTKNSYASVVPSLPLSVGFRFHWVQNVHLGVEYTYRFTTTDYLDNVGKEGKRVGNDALQSLSIILYLATKPQLPLTFIDTLSYPAPIKLPDSSKKQPERKTDSVSNACLFYEIYVPYKDCSVKIAKMNISEDLAMEIAENEQLILNFHKWELVNEPYEKFELLVAPTSPDGKIYRGAKTPPDTLRKRVQKLPQIKKIIPISYRLTPKIVQKKWTFKMPQHIKSGAFSGIDAMLMKDILVEKEALKRQYLTEIKPISITIKERKSQPHILAQQQMIFSSSYNGLNQELLKEVRKEYLVLNPPFLDRLPPLTVGLLEPKVKYAVQVPYFSLTEDGFNKLEERSLLMDNLAEYKLLMPEEAQGFVFPMSDATETTDELSGLWARLEEEALSSNDWFYYTCKSGDNYDYLYKRFKVRKNIIQAANHLAGDLPQTGKIRIPDLRQWIEKNPEAGDLQTLVRELGAR
jgi:hypothetical protein